MTACTANATPTSFAEPAAPIISLAGQDARSAADAMGQLYAGAELYCRPVVEDFRFRYVGVGDHEVSVRRFLLEGYVQGDIATDEVIVHWLSRGRARVDIGVDERPVGPGAPPAVFPSGRRFRIEFENVDQCLVHVDGDLLRSVAAEEYLVGSAFTLDTQVPPTAAAVDDWRASVATAVAVFRRHRPASPEWQDAKRAVARALLRLYPVQADTVPAEAGGSYGPRLDAALRFVHAHAAAQITVVDIADAAGLSVRGIQETFQRRLQQTPMTYLRRVRLGKVHTDLLATPPSTVTVSAVARRWGFTHMGRFSAAYVELFGEYPRQTLGTEVPAARRAAHATAGRH